MAEGWWCVCLVGVVMAGWCGLYAVGVVAVLCGGLYVIWVAVVGVVVYECGWYSNGMRWWRLWGSSSRNCVLVYVIGK